MVVNPTIISRGDPLVILFFSLQTWHNLFFSFDVAVKCDQDMKILSPALSKVEDRTFDFIMCNPPFFGELDQITKDRTGHRPPPTSVSTASENESFTEGGEVQFVTNMITESETYRDRVRYWILFMLPNLISYI